MNTSHADAMQEATRLTREGRLSEATAVIQRALGGQVGDGQPPAKPTRSEPRHNHERFGRLKSAVRDLDLGSRLREGLAGVGSLAGEQLGRGAAPSIMGMEKRLFSGPTGQRPYLMHVPDTAGPNAPLVVMLHGGTQDGAVFAAATGMNALADEHGFIVVYPEQTTAANAMRYWNWFSPNDNQRAVGEAAILAGIVSEVVQAHDANPAQVYVVGFSAGAAMAAALGDQYPDVFAGMGVHSGLASGSARDVGSAFAAMRQAPPSRPAREAVPTIVFHGSADQTVNVGNAHAVLRQFCPRPAERTSQRGQDGKPFTREIWTQDQTTCELWTVEGAGHVWCGGVPGGSYADPYAPNASREMVRFFGLDRP